MQMVVGWEKCFRKNANLLAHTSAATLNERLRRRETATFAFTHIQIQWILQQQQQCVCVSVIWHNIVCKTEQPSEGSEKMYL